MNKVEGVIFDWAGTTVDFGCFAPVNVFIDIFKNAGIEVTMEEARAPMGMLKIDHIRAMLSMPRISNLWEDQYGRAFTEQDVENLYAEFEPALLSSLKEYTDPIPEVVETVAIIKKSRFENWFNNRIYTDHDGCCRSKCCRKRLWSRFLYYGRWIQILLEDRILI